MKRHALSRQDKSRSLSVSDIQDVLIISAYGIGNALLFTPTLELLRRNLPHCQITALTFLKGEKEVFSRNPDVDRVLYCPAPRRFALWEKIAFVWKLRQLIRVKKFDVSLTAFPANRRESNLITFLIHARIRIGHKYRTKNFRNFGALHNVRLPIVIDRHDVEHNLALLRPLNINPTDAQRRLRFPVSSAETRFAEQFLQEHQIDTDNLLIGMHPGCKKADDYKRWPAERFQQLIAKLHSAYRARILVFGGPDELDLSHAIARKAQTPALAVTDLTLGQTTALIQKCRLFVGNDSGLMHLAVAMDTPCIGIFGPSDPTRVAPYGLGSRVVRKELSCSPCAHALHNLGSPFKCIHGRQICLQELSVSEVLTGIRQIIEPLDMQCKNRF